jgi:hypothetical protein
VVVRIYLKSENGDRIYLKAKDGDSKDKSSRIG